MLLEQKQTLDRGGIFGGGEEGDEGDDHDDDVGVGDDVGDNDDIDDGDVGASLKAGQRWDAGRGKGEIGCQVKS